MKLQWNQSGRHSTFPCRRPPGSTLLRFYLLFSYFTAVPACLFPSCTRPVNDLTEDVSVKVDSTWFTIAIDKSCNISDTLPPMNRLDIFLYGADGLKDLEHYETTSVVPDTLRIRAASRIMTAVAIVNSPRSFNRAAIERYDSIELLCYEFDEDSPDAPVMSGICTLEPGRDGTLTVTPLMSRVVLTEISNTMKGYVRLEDPRIYLENMSAYAEVLRTEGFRPTEMREGYITAKLPFDIGIFKQNPCTTLYCYPNDSPEPTVGSPETTMVLECEISGTTRRFSVKLPSLKRNSTQHVELTVNGAESFESKVY